MSTLRIKSYLAVLVLSVASIFVACNDEDEPQEKECTPDTTLKIETTQVTKVAENHHKVYTDIVINASVQEVWAVLTDWQKMPNWSTSFQGLSGDVSNGGQVVASFLNQGETIQIPHTLIYEEGVKFGWSESTGTPDMQPFGGFVDKHIFEVQAISDCQTRFIHSDEYVGEGNAVMNSEALANMMVTIYPLFNQELKAEVEK